MSFTEKPGTCCWCHLQIKAQLTVKLIMSGAKSYCWRCPQCGRQNPFKAADFFIAKEKIEAHLDAATIAALPVIMPPFHTRCAVCGGRDVENHHWAPRAIFGKDEAERWPQDNLCKTCHDEWHQRVTPQLINRHA